MTTQALTPAEQFFYDHAGLSYDPTTETEEQGRIRGAKSLALAEARMNAGPYAITLEDDPERDGDEPHGGPTFIVALHNTDTNEYLGSLGGVDVESDADPYIRVVSAGLALEYIEEPKPVVKAGPASRYEGSTETILEFNSGVPNGPGGLISLTRNDDGTLTVSLYRMDSGVKVNVSEAE